MRRYATAVRGQLEAGALDGPTTTAAAQAIAPGEQPPGPRGPDRRHMPTDGLGEASTGTRRARSSAATRSSASCRPRSTSGCDEDAVVEREEPTRKATASSSAVHDRGPRPPASVRAGRSRVGHQDRQGHARAPRRGQPPVQPRPAEHEIADDARIVSSATGASGLERAQHVAAHMADEVSEALAHGRAGPRRPPRRRLLLRRPARVRPPRARRRLVARHRRAQAEAGVDVVVAHRQPRHVLGRLGLLRPPLADPRFASQRRRDGKRRASSG